MSRAATLPRQVATRRRWGAPARVPYVVIAMYVLVAVIGPLVIDYDPVHTPLPDRLLAPGAQTVSGGVAWLGTDALGRDILAQIVYGARTSLSIGLATVLVACLVGVGIGIVAGYARGWLDAVLARIIDVLQAFPAILLAIVIAGVFARSVLVVVLALSVTAWISFARVTRGVALSLRERAWVDAARVMGVPIWSIIVRHVLPFTLGPVVALATLEFALVVLAEAGLSFLGIGLPSTTVSWGQTIANGQQYLETAWWISTLPGIALSLLIINIGILGDQLTARYGHRRRRT
ncbi:ABC transporter permease [Streptosporangium lutulentum]|uniref:Peptide/nickel transport system permease protein n=1 Tax=Streptosporangium lutulentum TaxID=1461250 RepID=A0ABT9Q4Z7_9ACTN|nr:ABC transporter permease [Streptosporangium lutulentum]MDP9841768.1 peptide/nickel transport system permease protein [Streptosporangium lutulentum]